MLQFCTLFETSYLSRGLALYESLKQHAQDFHIYILAFNDESYQLLNALELTNATIISMNQFENQELLAAKVDRSVGEYCWTCTSSLIKYCLDTFNLEHCTYLDADLYFYGNPKVLIEEVGAKSVLITEHRYTKKYDQSALSGKYCVQFMYFKNDVAGRECLDWWTKECINWCYNRHEDDKFGDQKYLDDWTDRFQAVHELKHLGGGMAPWNIQQFEFSQKSTFIQGTEITSGLQFPLIFYHFHEFTFLIDENVNLCNYQLSENQIKNIYRPYIRHLNEINIKIMDRFEVTPFKISAYNSGLKMKLKSVFNLFYKGDNIFKISKFL